MILGTSQLLDFYDQILETNFPCCYDDFVFHIFDVFSLDIRCYETLYVGSVLDLFNLFYLTRLLIKKSNFYMGKDVHQTAM